MPNFSELLAEYMARTGVSESELARVIGVRRQTIFRWKEGMVARPRYREDVLKCATKLRLIPQERDALLVAAGFPPEISAAPSPPQAGKEQSLVPAQTVTEEVGLPGVQIVRSESIVSRFRLPMLAAAVVGIGLVVLWLGGWSTFNFAGSKTVVYPVRASGEKLIVVAVFANYVGSDIGYNVSGRIQAALDKEISSARIAGLRVAVWPEVILDSPSAAEAVMKADASLLIWGEYDSGRVLARFESRGPITVQGGRELEQQVLTPNELTIAINSLFVQDVRAVALLTLGQLYEAERDFEKAQEVISQALASPPAERSDVMGTLYVHQGYLSQLSGKTYDAIVFYSKALAVLPTLASAYHNRGLAYAGTGQVEEAVKDYDKALELDPKSADTYNVRGAAYQKLGELEKAISDFSEAIALAPKMADAYTNRGLAYLRLGQSYDDRAIEDLQKARDLSPQSATAYNNLCWGLSLTQSPLEALSSCDQAIALDASYGISRDSRGVAYALLGRNQEAIVEFQAFLDWLERQGNETRSRYGQTRAEWIEALKQGSSPFIDDALNKLRTE